MDTTVQSSAEVKPAVIITESDAVQFKRVFNELLNHGFAESEEASAEVWADELCTAIATLGIKVHRRISVVDVVAWFNSKIPAGMEKGIDVGFCTSYYKNFHASQIGASSSCQFADTLEEAVALVMALSRTPEQLATDKRAAAAKLMAEADALSPTIVPAPVIQDREGAAAV